MTASWHINNNASKLKGIKAAGTSKQNKYVRQSRNMFMPVQVSLIQMILCPGEMPLDQSITYLHRCF